MQTNPLALRLAVGFLAGGLCAGLGLDALTAARPALGQPSGATQASPETPPSGEVTALRSLLPPQGHAMADVASHFENLWFAGGRQNWPLAEFFFNQTLSNLRWAVRLRPVRPARTGDIDLQSILEAVENSALRELKQAITAKSAPRFESAYRLTLETCNSCHHATDRGFVRLQVPQGRGSGLIDFEPISDRPVVP